MINKTSKIYKGVLESAGLGEVAFYLKKVKQNLGYASYALDNTDFEEISAKSKKIDKKIEALKNTILELDEDIENLGNELCETLENTNETEGD
jgi:predicted translin family RNA/ssDNA-binding protein